MDTGQNLNLGQSVTYNREDEIFQGGVDVNI